MLKFDYLAIPNLGCRNGDINETVLLDMGGTHHFSKNFILFRGPSRALYSSVSQHCFYYTHPTDDIESLIYLLALLLRGNLPWSGYPLIVDEEESTIDMKNDPVVIMKREILDRKTILYDSSFFIKFVDELQNQRKNCGLYDIRTTPKLGDLKIIDITINYDAFRSILREE